MRVYGPLISGLSIFSELETFKSSDIRVRSLTLFIVQSCAYLIDPTSRPCAEMLRHATFAIGFSFNPSTENIRRAPVMFMSSKEIFRTSHKPRSAGKTGVASTVQAVGTFL